MENRDPGLVCLETAVAMFEQYYHPSNGGKWSSSLAMFMRELAFHLCRRLVAEHSVLVSSFDIGMDSGGESEEEPSDEEDDESVGTAEDGVDSSVTDEDIAAGGMDGMESSSKPLNGKFPRRHLTAETRMAIVKLVMRLALKGQSGKDSIMRRYSSQVLCMLANIEPRIVLPEVERHFVTALETITAAKQYGNAIQTLSLCVRPMLLAGIPPHPVDSMDVEGESDAVRRLNAIQLYCCVLSCVGAVDNFHTCLYSEEWVVDLLARIFTVLSNLDSPGSGGEHNSHPGSQQEEEASFLLDGNSMFRPLIELLFARVDKDLRKRLVRQTSEYLLGNTFSSVAPEAAILCNSMAWADPEETEKCILAPLISKLLEECDAIKQGGQDFFGASVPRLSKVQETTLAWRLGLMFPSPSVQSAASRCLSSLLIGLVSFYPLHQYAPAPIKLEQDGLYLEPFVDKFGEWDLSEHSKINGFHGWKDSPALPVWHEPCQSEVSLAEQILATFLQKPKDRLRELASQSEPINKQEVRYLLNSIEGVIEGARSCLPDFEEFRNPERGDEAAIVGKSGVTIGHGGIRSQVTEALVSLAKLVDMSDVETLTILLRLLDSVLSVGSAEYHSSDSSASAWASDDRWLQQPAVAGFLTSPECAGDLIWRRRRPRWVAIEKVYMNLEWRASQAVYRDFASISNPWISVKRIPKIYTDAVGLSLHYVLKGGSSLRDLAGSLVERAAKRFPRLTEYIYAPLCSALAKVPHQIQLDLSVTCSDLIPVLLQAAKDSASRAAEAVASGVPESEEDQSMGIGATTLMRWVSGWRYFTRNYHGFRALILSMIASFSYTGPEVQVSMAMTQVMFALRSMRPSGAESSDVADQICLDCIRLVQGCGDGRGSGLSGRQETIVTLYPLFILPDITAGLSKELIVFYGQQLASDTPLSRKVAMVAIVVMLLPLWRPYYDESFSGKTPKMENHIVRAGEEGLKKFLDEQGEIILPKLVQMLSLSHHAMATLAEDERDRRMRIISGTKEDTVVTAVLSTLLKGLEWPSTPSAFKDIAKGNFTVRHARIVQVLAQVNPSIVIKSLKDPIESILSKPQDYDKPATAAAAEICAGLLASGVVFDAAGSTQSPWNQWLGKLVFQALENAPFDFLNIWGDCVLRFAVNGLKEKGMDKEYVPLVLETALTQRSISSGIISVSDVHKRVIYLTELLQEVIGDCLGQAPKPLSVGQIEESILINCLDELPSLIDKGSETDISRQAVAGLVADVCTIILTTCASKCPGGVEKMIALESRVHSMLDELYYRFDLAVDYFFNQNKDKLSEGTSKSVSSGGIDSIDTHPRTLEESKALSHIAFVCELTYQFLAKYTLDGKSSCTSVYAVFLVQKCHSSWRGGSQTVLGEAMRLLEDPKLEVRDMACATVSGVIRIMTPASQRECRNLIISRSQEVFPDRKRRRRTDGRSSSDELIDSTAVRHGAVLGLKALVISSPYDVPEWLPEVLMSLVRLASEPAPVRSTVRESLSEFRRTHEEGGLLAIKDAISAEHWEAIRDVATPANYFV
eukprot:jgi/Picre1/32275/NNA_007621.t1